MWGPPPSDLREPASVYFEMTDVISDKVRSEFGGRGSSFWLNAAALFVGALLVVFVVRSVFVGPIDSLAVRQACAAHGFDIDRPVSKVEQTSKLGVFSRVNATCTYGSNEGEELEDLSTTLEEIETGGFFTASKFLGLLLQVGSLAIYGRMVAEPLYRKFVLDGEESR